MAVAAWPSQMPYEVVVTGASAGQSYLAPLQSETEGGPPLMRPRPGPRATEMPFVSRLLSRAQWNAFEQFARDTLRQGTLPFTMPVYHPGSGYVTRTCQIKDGAWQTDLSAVSRFRISFTLVVFNL